MGYEFRTIAACDMCGSADFRLMGQRLSGHQGLNPKAADGPAIPIKQCRCGLIFCDPLPVPRDVTDHYGIPAEDYWTPDHFEVPLDYFAEEIGTAKRHLKFIPGMNALDVGVGSGRVMTALNRAGFDTYGIEPSPSFREKAIELLHISPDRIRLATIEDADFPLASFDFITFGAVLEHLYSPSHAIEKALGWLKPGGIIQAEIPSSRWLISALINTYYRLRRSNFVTNLSPLHPPFHLYEFSVEAFQQNGQRLGYSIAAHKFMVCEIYHVPKAFHPPLRWLMALTSSGMQLTVYLRRNQTVVA